MSDKTIHVACSDQFLRKVKHAAIDKGVTMAEYVRMAVSDSLEREENRGYLVSDARLTDQGYKLPNGMTPVSDGALVVPDSWLDKD